MTQYLGPPLERHERKIRPNDGDQTIQEKYCKPLIVPDNFRKTGLPLVKNVKTRGDQREVHTRIERASLLQYNTARVQTKDVEPFRNLPGADDQEPDERNPERARYIRSLANVSPVEEENEGDC